MKILNFIVFSLGILGLTNANVCSQSNNENLLKYDHEYTYKYETHAVSEAVGTTSEKSKISILCDVLISHASECAFILKLEECKVKAASETSEFGEVPWIDESFPGLSEYPIQFFLENGVVTDVYTNTGDAIHFVNIKKAALSAFVFKFSNTMGKTFVKKHTDIHGTCPLIIKHDSSSNGIVKTSKNMLSCSFPSRKDVIYSPWSVLSDMSFIKHIINSTTDCVYKIDSRSKRIDNVTCKERHAVMLESSHNTDSAVQTNILYTISYVESRVQKTKPNIDGLTRKTGIQFEYENSSEKTYTSTETFITIAKKLLFDLVEDSNGEIKLQTIPQFTDFVDFLRTASNVIPFVEEVKSCSFLPETMECTLERKELSIAFLSDALVQCNSLPCIEAFVNLAKSGDLSELYMSFVYFTWGINMHYRDTAIFKAIQNLCVSTKSDSCYMSLGSLLRTWVQTEESNYDLEQLQQLQDIAKSFFESINQYCSNLIDDETSIKEVIKYLRVIANMEEESEILVPEGYKYLVDCLKSEHSPTKIKLSILEVLKRLKPCKDSDKCDYTYEKILPIQKTPSLPSTLRAMSYDYLIHIPQKNNFEEEIIDILRKDEDLQLKSYIASSLDSLFLDTVFVQKEKRFVESLKELMMKHEISLESFIHHPSAKSHTSSKTFSSKIPFDRHIDERFGLKFEKSYIYEQPDVFPKYFHKNIFTQIFNKFINFAEIGGVTEGLEDLAIVFQRALRDPDSRSTVFRIFHAFEEVLKEIGSKGSDLLKKYNFDENVIENIVKLEEVYKSYNPKSQPSFYAYINLFGSTLRYFSLKDIMSLTSKVRNMADLADGKMHTFNNTRVIRLIEAYHQIPTMMGLPLNWTTNATLAMSWRSGLKMQFDREKFSFHSRGYFQPSAGLTFLNRMVIDFPSVTQIGIQTNSSGYTSTNFKANIDYSKDKKVFSIQKPTKREKILELFRTNQIIKHGNYSDIPDWEIERSTSTTCTGSKLNSIVGLEFCVDKSYPLVTKLSRPWALMAGWSKWRLYADSYDEKLSSYDFEIVQLPGAISKELVLRLSTPGSDKNREVILKGKNDEDKGEMKLDVKITELPYFAVSFVNSEISDNELQDGHRSILRINLDKDISYELQYHVGTNQKDQLIIRKELLSFNTPFNFYKYQRETKTIGENTNRNVILSHENLNPDGKWLHRILPLPFWEDDSKAWVEMHINWNQPDIQQNTVSRKTISFIKYPQSTIELIGKSVELEDGENIRLSLTKKDNINGKLLSFVNFTYDNLISQSESLGNEIKIVNVTIPQKSWSANMKRIIDEDKCIYQITLKTAKMKPKNPENDYVGWWQKDSNVDFDIEEHNITLDMELKDDIVHGKELTEKYSIPNCNIDEKSDLRHKLITVNTLLKYPFDEKSESLALDGFLIISKNSKDNFRFQKHMTLESSYHNLVMKTFSVYESNKSSASLDLKTIFTHTVSQKKAYHIVKYNRMYSKGFWPDVELHHNIKSNAFDLISNLTLKHNSNGENLHTLLLFIDTNSSFWHMLDTSLSQIVEQVNPEYTYETCNFSHPLLNINVTADWKGERDERKHQKKVLFSSPSGRYESSELHYRTYTKKRSTLELFMANDNGRSLSYDRTLDSDSKRFKIMIDYSEMKNDGNNLELLGQIIKENLQIWKIRFNMEKLSSIKRIFHNGYKKVEDKITTIAKDKDHPLNKILEPTLKATIFEYYEGLISEKNKVKVIICNDIKETLHNIKEFYKEPSEIITNIVNVSRETTHEISHYLENYSTIVWFIGNFNVVEVFYKYYPLAFQLLLPEDQTIHLEFTTGRMLKWGSFNEWPSLSFEDMKSNLFQKENEIKPHHRPWERSKQAMIFGPLHVHTFDDTLYDSAEYSSDCSFILAHDLRKSSFTVLSTKTAIHMLFPDVSVSVNDKNQVFINGSQIETSLPFVAHDRKVTVFQSNVIEIESPSLKVVCSGKDFLCVLELRLWHHGGVFGLLGNSDGLKANDFMLPNGKLTSDVLEFVKSYEVSGNPVCKNLRLPMPPPFLVGVDESCRSQFYLLCDQDKIFRESFINFCKSDFQEDSKACYAGAGYSAMCYFKNLKSNPIDCHGEKQENSRIGQKLEIILLVQEHKSLNTPEMKNSPHKGIESMLTALEDKFKANGYSSVLFSLVGFGRKGAYYQPTVHSSKNNTWVPVQAMVKELMNSLVFEGDEDADTINALRYAVEVLGYDSFHSKVVIVLTPKDKQRTEKKTLHSVQSQLNKNGITLYSLSSYPSVEKGKKVFGVRANGSILPSPKKDGSASLSFPKGDLAKLAAATRGSVFLSNFISTNAPASYFGEFAEEVWAKVHEESQSCRDCTAVKSGWWWKVSQCSIETC